MRKTKDFILLLAVCLSSSFLRAEVVNPDDYLQRYEGIAIEEMLRGQIPASITLAQGIHESGWGNGKLATEANNHFGIKCKGLEEWSGESYYLEDDDYEEGELVKSCFRKYPSALDSYRDHTDFLVNRSHYEPLFVLETSNYRAWAHGLKKCGYATDPLYAEKLISIIERYELYLLDVQVQPVPALADATESAEGIYLPAITANEIHQPYQETSDLPLVDTENNPDVWTETATASLEMMPTDWLPKPIIKPTPSQPTMVMSAPTYSIRGFYPVKSKPVHHQKETSVNELEIPNNGLYQMKKVPLNTEQKETKQQMDYLFKEPESSKYPNQIMLDKEDRDWIPATKSFMRERIKQVKKGIKSGSMKLRR